MDSVLEKLDENDGATWGRNRRMQEFRLDVIDQYKHIHGGDIVQGIGTYWGTVEVQWLAEPFSATTPAHLGAGAPIVGFGNANFAVNVVPGSPIIDTAFSLAIGDVSPTWFGTPPGGIGPTGAPHLMNPSDTNLQNPGMNTYADEVFIIEAIGARVRGMRVGYSAAAIETMKPLPAGNTLSMLQGNQMVRDQYGLVIPAELFNQYDDTFRLAKTLEEIATLHFKWTDAELGGSTNTVDVMIDSFLNITKEAKGMKRTSGGNQSVLDLPNGYIWCLDKMWQANEAEGGNGIFDVELHLDESVSYPFQPTFVFGSPGPVAPAGIALYWEIRLYGTSLVPSKATRERRPQSARRGR
jgi:hypothetical protein